MANKHVRHIVNNIWRVGPVNRGTSGGSMPGYGTYLYFCGGPASVYWDSDNSDPLWIARYNVATDNSELRINIGDNDAYEDALVIGRTTTGTWYPAFRVQANKTVIFMKNAEPADGELAASQFAFWLTDTPGGTVLNIKAKDSGGTVRTATVALS